MKKNFCVLLIILSVIACKKSQVTNPVDSGAKLLLSSESDLNAFGKDTVNAFKYSYDSNNRLIQQVEGALGANTTTLQNMIMTATEI